MGHFEGGFVMVLSWVYMDSELGAHTDHRIYFGLVVGRTECRILVFLWSLVPLIWELPDIRGPKIDPK